MEEGVEDFLNVMGNKCAYRKMTFKSIRSASVVH